jgi:hypothetical protein
MRVAVVTDAVSTGNYFPSWLAYYSGQFGTDSIHVFTYPNSREEFKLYDLGALHALPSAYSDDLRRDTITAYVNSLLQSHDLVLRVDVDEFLVPDPAKFPDLITSLKNFPGSHVTAYGFDVIQSPQESVLNLTSPILAQRQFAYALTALNKTCVTRVPLKWNRGFHYCTVPPTFGDLYLFHTKRADIGLQIAWNQKMRLEAGEDAFVNSYYGWTEKTIEDFHKGRFRLPLIDEQDALARTAFNKTFLDGVRFSEKTGFYDGIYVLEQVNVVIPPRFRVFF